MPGKAGEDNGEYLTQGPGLSNLTSGTQAGNVTELISFILDKATSADVGWAILASERRAEWDRCDSRPWPLP